MPNTMRKILSRRDGMALVLTLMAVSFMVAVTVQLFSEVNWQMRASANLRESIRLDAMNRSGLSLTRAALLADQRENKFDSLHDSWNMLDNESLGSIMGRGRLEVGVTDLSGLLQVNALVATDKDTKKKADKEAAQQELWVRFLTSGRFAVEDRDAAIELLDAIRDWIDKDDEVRDKGAESGFYQSLSPGYAIRNGPLQYKEELLLIRGMTSELFYGNEEYAGIADFVSVVGSEGAININSAPLEILMALAEGIDQDMAGDLIKYREDEQHRDNLAQPEWYKGVSGFPGYITIDKGLLTVVSHFFQVTSTATNNDITRTGKGVIVRDDNEAQKLISWEVR